MRAFIDRLYEFGVIPVIKITESDKAADLGRVLVESGLPVAEITLRTPQALEAVARMRAANPDLLMGIGTVLTLEQAQTAADAGADFIVSPCLAPKVFAFCRERDIPVVPGAYTPSEMQQALELGAELIKFFPANLGGPKLIKTYGDIFGDIRMMPTGGVSEETLADFLVVPQVVCCGGSYLAPAKLIAEGAFEDIAERIRRAVQIVAEKRG